MARPLRIEYPGAFYHVIHRGNAGEDIFISDRDREKFLEYVQKAVDRFGIRVHTYCLMTNHYHLLVETPHPNLSRSIKWINGSYVTYFNRKQNRPGHLFQGRFKAILVDADEYLKPLSRYIHLNPIRAGRVETLESYPWSSYPALVGRQKPGPGLETGLLLSLFGKTKNTAFGKYRDYVQGADFRAIEDPGKAVASGSVLGGEAFVTWVKETFLFNRSEPKEIPRLKELMPAWKPESVVERVCEAFGCQPDQILEKGKKKNLPRDVAIYLARELTGRTGVDLGLFFGKISGAGITLRHNHVSAELARNLGLKRKVARIRKAIVTP